MTENEIKTALELHAIYMQNIVRSLTGILTTIVEQGADLDNRTAMLQTLADAKHAVEISERLTANLAAMRRRYAASLN